MGISLAMVDPGAGAGGGLIALCLFVVGPVAIAAHLVFRRFAVVSLSLATVFGLFLLGLWGYFDSGDPESFRLVWVGFVLALVVSALAGLPALVARRFGRGDGGR